MKYECYEHYSVCLLHCGWSIYISRIIQGYKTDKERGQLTSITVWQSTNRSHKPVLYGLSGSCYNSYVIPIGTGRWTPLRCEGIFYVSLSSLSTFTDISSNVSLTNVSGSITTPTIKAYTNGKIITFQIGFSTTASISVGSNIFTATINGLPTRNIDYTFFAFYSSSILGLVLKSADNSITCRALAYTLGSGSTPIITGIMAHEAST